MDDYGLGDFGWHGLGELGEGGPWHPMYGGLASAVGTGAALLAMSADTHPSVQKHAELIGFGVDVALAAPGLFYGPARAAAVTLLAAGFGNHGPRYAATLLAESGAGAGAGTTTSTTTSTPTAGSYGTPYLVQQNRRTGALGRPIIQQPRSLGAPPIQVVNARTQFGSARAGR